LSASSSSSSSSAARSAFTFHQIQFVLSIANLVRSKSHQITRNNRVRQSIEALSSATVATAIIVVTACNHHHHHHHHHHRANNSNSIAISKSLALLPFATITLDLTVVRLRLAKPPHSFRPPSWHHRHSRRFRSLSAWLVAFADFNNSLFVTHQFAIANSLSRRQVNQP
jgi:hypothetical protein